MLEAESLGSPEPLSIQSACDWFLILSMRRRQIMDADKTVILVVFRIHYLLQAPVLLFHLGKKCRHYKS